MMTMERKLNEQLMKPEEVIFACDMNAIPAQDRKHHVEVILKLFQHVNEITEVADGYAFRLPDGNEVLLTAAEFISREKVCCPFFRFDIRVEPGRSSQLLYLTGPDGVKPFIQAEIGRALNPAVARSAGFRSF